MRNFALISLLVLTAACTTDEMVAQAHDECTKIGYPVGSPEYTECVERGYRQLDTTQDAAVAATTSAVLTAAILSAWY